MTYTPSFLMRASFFRDFVNTLRPPERIAFRRPCIVFAPLVIDEFVQRVRVGLVVHVVHHIGIVARFRRIGAVLR